MSEDAPVFTPAEEVRHCAKLGSANLRRRWRSYRQPAKGIVEACGAVGFVDTWFLQIQFVSSRPFKPLTLKPH